MTDPQLLKNTLASTSFSINRIRKTRDIAIEAKDKHVIVYKPPQAKMIALFKDRIHKEIWEFCQSTGTNLADYGDKYIEITNTAINPLYQNDPSKIDLDERGNVSDSIIAKFMRKRFDGGIKQIDCQLCWGSGFAQGIIGKISWEGQPQNMVRIDCWCKK